MKKDYLTKEGNYTHKGNFKGEKKREKKEEKI